MCVLRDDRAPAVLKDLKSKYSLEEIIGLVGALLSWGPIQMSRYSEDSIYELLEDLILLDIDAIIPALTDPLPTIPLLINSENYSVRIAAKWRMSCGK